MSFRKNEEGSVAVIFGLSITVFLGAFALAVDFARMTATRTSLAVMADTAALSGATQLSTSTAAALTQAYNTFDSQKAKNAATVTRTMTVGSGGGSVIASASATVDLYFGGIIGVSQMTVAAQSEAQRQVGFLDVQLLLDVSASMGLAATPAEMTRLKGLTKPYMDAWAALPANVNTAAANALVAEKGCAFACHVREGWEPNGGTALDFARANNVQLRWDVVTAASTSMATTLLNAPQAQGNGAVIRVGGYSFADNLSMLFNLTTSPSSISFQISSDSLLQFNTRANTALGQMPAKMGPSGDGLTQATSKKVIVIATDGVDGVRNGGHQPLDPAQCDAIKATGVTIAILNVQYVKDIASPGFNTSVAAIYDQIAPNLQACASSPDLYLAASDPSSIQSAFQTMALRVASLQPRISN